MEAIDESWKNETKTIEMVWKKIFLEMRKHAHKILCEKSEDMAKFKGRNMEETYENIVQNLMNVKLDYKLAEKKPEKEDTAAKTGISEKVTEETQSKSVASLESEDTDQITEKRKITETKRKKEAIPKRVKEDSNGWTLDEAFKAAKKGKTSRKS